MAENRKSRGRKLTLFRKLIVGYIVLAIIPVVIVTAIMSLIYVQRIREQSNHLVDQNALQNEVIVQERMESFTSVLYNLVTDSSFLKLTEVLGEEETEWGSVTENHIQTRLEEFVYTYDEIRGALFISNDLEYVGYSKWYGDSNDLFWRDVENRSSMLKDLMNSNELTFLHMQNLREGHVGSVDYAILLGIPVRDLRTKECFGVLVFAIDDGVLLFKNTADLGYGVQTLVVDNEKKIMTGVPTEYVNQALEEYLSQEYKKDSVYLRYHDIEGTEWTIVNIIDKDSLWHGVTRAIGMVTIIIVVITTVFYLIAWNMCKGYAIEVRRLALLIENYDAKKPELTEIAINKDDELTLILNSFRNMANRNHSLVETLRQKNEEIRETENERRKAEIKALEAQINPHFLYNTLETINWKAIENGQEEISDSLGMLGSLLRYSVSNIDILVLLRAEIEWLRKYVALQRERFQNSFDCVYEISEEAMDFPVYKMLLQPLIENAVLHAFESIRENGLIKVHAFVRVDGKLELCVQDNGSGITEEKLQNIREEIKDAKADCRSIGISNVANRLRIYYHGEASMLIDSKENSGTTVKLIIPYRETV